MNLGYGVELKLDRDGRKRGEVGTGRAQWIKSGKWFSLQKLVALLMNTEKIRCKKIFTFKFFHRKNFTDTRSVKHGASWKSSCSSVLQCMFLMRRDRLSPISFHFTPINCSLITCNILVNVQCQMLRCDRWNRYLSAWPKRMPHLFSFELCAILLHQSSNYH